MNSEAKMRGMICPNYIDMGFRFNKITGHLHYHGLFEGHYISLTVSPYKTKFHRITDKIHERFIKDTGIPDYRKIIKYNQNITMVAHGADFLEFVGDKLIFNINTISTEYSLTISPIDNLLDKVFKSVDISFIYPKFPSTTILSYIDRETGFMFQINEDIIEVQMHPHSKDTHNISIATIIFSADNCHILWGINDALLSNKEIEMLDAMEKLPIIPDWLHIDEWNVVY